MTERVETPELAGPLLIPASPEPGVNLAGFLEVESGFGEVARRLAGALASSGIPVAAIPYRGTLARQEHPMQFERADEARYDTNLIALSARDLTTFASAVGPGFFARRYSIGVWFWETDDFSAEERTATRLLDELWVASEYVRESVAAEVDIPVHVVPIPVEAPPGPFRSRAELDLPEGFTFLFVFDFWSGPRKNPTAVVEAFSRAFRPGEGPVLVLKSVHGRDWKREQFEHLRQITGSREDILIRDGYVSADERDSYLAACDCYVSLHRSEGLGLTMAEAMACAKPVLATGYSGNLEFMSAENSFLVPYRLVDVPDTWWAHTEGAQWAEPDVDRAAQLMRRMWEHPEEAQAIGARARQDILARFSPGRTADFVDARVTAARSRGAMQARASEYDARPAIIEASQELARKGIGDSLASGTGSRPRAVLRRLLRRALWPHLEDQRRFEAAVLDALTTLHRSVEDLEQRVVRLESLPHTPAEHEPP